MDRSINRENNHSTLFVIAALNEETGIGPTLVEIERNMNNFQCLVVDGRSSDRTVELARSFGAEVITQGRAGKGDAIATAITYARSMNFDFVAFTDGDFTYPAIHLWKMIRVLDENPDVGMVCGNRFENPTTPNSLLNIFHFGNRFIAFAHNLLNGIHLDDPLTGLRLVRWSILKNWKPRSEGFDIEVEMNYYVEKRGYRIVEVPIEYRTRLGEKKLKVKHGFTIMKRIMEQNLADKIIA